MNIYEDGNLEQTFEEITDLMGQLMLDLLVVSLRKAVQENQVFKEWAEVNMPRQQEGNPF